MAYDIEDFVREALSKGVSKSDINIALKHEAWTDEEISAALGSFGEKPVAGVPVPRRKTYTSAKEGFFYLLMFLTLCISAVSFGSLIFDFINMIFPDPLQRNYDLSSIRYSVSCLIVAYPIFLWITIFIRKSIARDPSKQDSKVRKWLIYLTLLIAATIIICDLIGLLVTLLGGELNTRVLLKMTTILIIAGLIFGYYRWDLGHEVEKVNGR